MFTFAYPYILWLLFLIPAFCIIYLYARRRRVKNLKRFGSLPIIKHLMPDVSPYKPPVKFVLEMSALALIIIALARPWGGVKDEKTEKNGIEVIIAVDASNSMLASATGDPAGPQRMRTAKTILEKLVSNLHNDRVGLIFYAAKAYTLIPVTNDYVSARMFLNSIDPSLIEDQGTNIGSAIDLATHSFDNDKNIGKAIILLTDAEDLEDKQNALDAAKNAAKNNIQIDVVGVGTETPVPIPYNGEYIIDPETGQTALTNIDEDLAAEIAKAGKGIYVNASNSDALGELTKQLDMVKRSSLKSSSYAVHDELFPFFLWLALALLVIDFLISDSKIKWLDRFTFFKKD